MNLMPASWVLTSMTTLCTLARAIAVNDFERLRPLVHFSRLTTYSAANSVSGDKLCFRLSRGSSATGPRTADALRNTAKRTGEQFSWTCRPYTFKLKCTV